MVVLLLYRTFLANKVSLVAAGYVIPFVMLWCWKMPSLPQVNTVFNGTAIVIARLTLCPVGVVPGCSIRPDKVETVPRVYPTSQPRKASIQSHHELMLLFRVNRDQVGLVKSCQIQIKSYLLSSNLFFYTLVFCILPSFLLRKVLVTFPIKCKPSGLTIWWWRKLIDFFSFYKKHENKVVRTYSCIKHKFLKLWKIESVECEEAKKNGE